MESGSGVRCGIAKGGSCGVRTQGTTIIREREEQMVRWCSGMAHPCQAPHGHGIATSGVHMGIIVKFGEALACVKSPISRTSGTIYVVTRMENVLVRTPWKETWLELERPGVETTKGWKVRRESDGKRVG